MRFVNLTPHAIVIRTSTGDVTVAASGQVARVATGTRDAQPVALANGMLVPCQVKTTGAVTGLPKYGDEPDAVYLVSGMVLAALRESCTARDDVAAPATGPDDGAIRDDAGRIIAVTRLDVLN